MNLPGSFSPLPAESEPSGSGPWLRLVLTDVLGSVHAVEVPAARAQRALHTGIPVDGSVLEGPARQLEADMLLRGDFATRLAWEPEVDRVAAVVTWPDGAPFAGDPRTSLTGALAARPEDLARPLVGAELEFYLVDAAGRPADAAGYLQDDPETLRVVRSAATRLSTAGVEVSAVHGEAGPGQYEVDLAPTTPLRLADALVFTREVLSVQARQAGLRALFGPRPLPDAPGSGLHLHLLEPRWVGERGTLRDEGRTAVAGLLAHAGGLCALAAPIAASYARLHAGPEAPSFATWAHTNRGALVRVSSFGAPEVSIEFRGADPIANPYLLLVGVLAAVDDGIESASELPPADEEGALGYDPAPPGHSSPRRLPRGLDEALDALEADDVLSDALGPEVLGVLLPARRAEAAQARANL